MSPVPQPLYPHPPRVERLSPVWTAPTTAQSPHSADLFMILFVSAFLFLTAAVLRLFPWIAPLPPHPRWTPGDSLNYANEAEALRHFRSFAPYGAVETRERRPTYESLIALEDSIGQAKLGMTEEQIAILPTYHIGASDEQDSSERRGTTCAICRDVWHPGDLICVLPCADEFHRDCIAPWLKQQATCPLCRCRFA
eukprot:GFKZ01003419.1.p1 GENE.GFKZ01003419.1~~GFKZ01003419.1.p1  ORF type:complete len:196 (-),score=8.06 GFKZ01003419.1:1383-1970(-)